MKLNRFTIATLAPLFIGSPLVAQQSSSGQTRAIKAEAAQDQPLQNQPQGERAAQGQPRPDQPNRERAVERNPAQRDAADRNTVRRDAAERDSSERSNKQDSQVNARAFAECLAIMNREQVLVARYAKENASSEDVKAFAAMLEKDHQSCLNELQKTASQDTAGQPADNTAANTRNGVRTAAAETTSQDQETVRRAAAGNTPEGRDGAKRAGAVTTSHAGGHENASVDFVQLRREVSEQVMKDTHETLSSKEGAEFDKCFVAMQVAKHGMMKSGLTVLGRHATGDLHGLIEQSLAKNEEHSKAAESLLQKLVKADATTSNDDRK